MDETGDGTLTQRDRIEEAHGVWELAVTRVAAMVEVALAVDAQAVAEKKVVNLGVAELLRNAVKVERAAFHDWQRTMVVELGCPR